MKYEMIFGDPQLFNHAPDDAVLVSVQLGDFRYFTEENLHTCKKFNIYKLQTCDTQLAMRRIIQEPKHSDDINVDAFAECMKDKLERSRNNGRGGWEMCQIEFLSSELKRHVDKGDPIDVANFAMMIHQRGEKIKQTEPKRWTVEDHVAMTRAVSVGAGFMDATEITLRFLDANKDNKPHINNINSDLMMEKLTVNEFTGEVKEND